MKGLYIVLFMINASVSMVRVILWMARMKVLYIVLFVINASVTMESWSLIKSIGVHAVL